MSLLEEVFAIPEFVPRRSVVRMWPALQAELWSLVLLGPLVATNLRAKPFCD